jgi:hypothetical protein
VTRLNKPLISIGHGPVRHYLRQISKAALVDILVMIVREEFLVVLAGETDDEALERVLRTLCEPILRRRDDKLPSRSK